MSKGYVLPFPKYRGLLKKTDIFTFFEIQRFTKKTCCLGRSKVRIWMDHFLPTTVKKTANLQCWESCDIDLLPEWLFLRVFLKESMAESWGFFQRYHAWFSFIIKGHKLKLYRGNLRRSQWANQWDVMQGGRLSPAWKASSLTALPLRTVHTVRSKREVCKNWSS